MSSASPPKAIAISPPRQRSVVRVEDEPQHDHSPSNVRHSPIMTRTLPGTREEPNPLEMMERQRTMDEDFAIQISRARSASLAHVRRPSATLQPGQHHPGPPSPSTTVDLNEPDIGFAIDDVDEGEEFPFPARSERDEDEQERAMDLSLLMMSQAHDPKLLAGRQPSISSRDREQPATNEEEDSLLHAPGSGGGVYRSNFDFSELERFGGRTEEEHRDVLTSPIQPFPTNRRQRKLSHTQSAPAIASRKGASGKLALFESTAPPPFDFPPLPQASNDLVSSENEPSPAIPPVLPAGTQQFASSEDQPYRFSFYSNNLRSTIHARSLDQLPAPGQTFKELFLGRPEGRGLRTQLAPLNGKETSGTSTPTRIGTLSTIDDDTNSWWLDVLSPTDEEMRVLSKCFGIHPLTAEDIQTEEPREKIELFRNYYLVSFRSFDQNQYSPTYLDAINYYIVVFREGILSFHFRQSPHPQNVRRRIKQLKDYISVTSDWISYALIDDITDAFGPLIQNIEYEVDSIDELVLILKDTEQSDMLRRIGTCRKKVMSLLRLMGNKADVVKGLAKRCNENWSMAPKSDIGLYLSDIQDHLITMTQSLNHYEKLLSRSHSNYLAQISIEMTDANNQINDVLSRLTALGTILIPMNLITGLWGMNVHVPGQDITDNYSWFIGIICVLVGLGAIGSFATYRLMRRSRRR